VNPKRTLKLRTTVFFVYAIIDPRDGQIFYIGSGVNPIARLKHHIWDSEKGENNPRAKRIRSIFDSGNTPKLEILSKTLGIISARKKELIFMELYPHNLTNGSYPISSQKNGRKHRVSITRGASTHQCTYAKLAIDAGKSLRDWAGEIIETHIKQPTPKKTRK